MKMMDVILSRSSAEAKNLAERRTGHEILRPTASEWQTLKINATDH